MIYSEKNQRVNSFKAISSQAGWTMWSMLFVMSVLFVVAYVAIQLVPIFSANENVKNAMRQSVEDKDLSKISRNQIIRGMQDQLYLDGSHELLDYKKDLNMARNRNKFLLEVKYEREVPLVANLVLIARFNPKVECELNGRCDP